MILTTIFENEYFIIIDKPAEWLSVPARFKDDPRPVVGLELEKQLAQQLYPVHRLDEEVSGLLLFAKSPKAQSVANRWFEHKTIQKFYRALTEGKTPDWNYQEWSCLLMRGKKRAYEADFGKESLTQVTFIGEVQGHLEWRLSPVTGRSHQLRYEMSKHGFPILGDQLYGSTQPYQAPGIALRAIELNLEKIQDRLGLPSKILIS